jgi:hypothetical protein
MTTAFAPCLERSDRTQMLESELIGAFSNRSLRNRAA